MMKRLTVIATAVLLGLGAAAAQPTKGTPKETKESAKDAVKPNPPPVSNTPERTTASFGDWILRCEAPPAPAKRQCEVALVLSAQGQAGAVAQVAMAKVAGNDGRLATIVLPHNVSLLSRPQIVAKAGAAPLEFVWQRCNPGACFASALLTPDAVGSLAALTEAGKIVYKNAAEQEVTLPFSVRGLPQSLDALAKAD